MTDIIGRSTGKPLTLGVERDGKLIQLTATPESGKGIKVDGTAAWPTTATSASPSAGTPPDRSRRSAVRAPPCPPCGTSRTRRSAGLGQTFSPSGLQSVFHQVTSSKAAQSAVNNPGSAPRPVSIVGIANLGAQSEQAGLASVLILLIAINIVFGILNMLPMIPLDGGHVAVAGYEWIRTKRGQPYYRADITKLFPVAALFIAFLLVFVFAGIFLDITHPLQIPH